MKKVAKGNLKSHKLQEAEQPGVVNSVEPP